MTERRPLLRDFLLLACFCGFFFFFGLGYFGLIGADEPRYAQVAREMLARLDWITPTLGGKPWLEKPPLYYWQAMLAYRIFGVSDWAARLPSAVDATLMVMAVYFFLRRFRAGIELDGALLTASAAGIIGFARAASTDMPLAAMFTIAMLAWLAWFETKRKWLLAAFYGFAALGMLAKGPVSPFLAALIIMVFAVLKRESRIVRQTLWLPGILFFCAVALPWYVAAQIKNPEFLQVFIMQHNLERFSTNLYRHSQPFWYYIPVALLALVPWIVFVVDALYQGIRDQRFRGPQAKTSGDAQVCKETAETNNAEEPASPATLNSNYSEPFRQFFVLWFLLPIIFFSISRSKLPGYILPAIPAGTLLLALYIRQQVINGKHPRIFAMILHALISTLLLVPAIQIQYILLQHRLPWNHSTLYASILVFVLCLFIIGVLTRLGFRALRFATLVPTLLIVAALLKIGGTALDVSLSERPVAMQVERINQGLPVALLDVRRETAYGLAFYLSQVFPEYETGRIPEGEHILITRTQPEAKIQAQVQGRKLLLLGHFAPQHLDYYWISP